MDIMNIFFQMNWIIQGDTIYWSTDLTYKSTLSALQVLLE